MPLPPSLVEGMVVRRYIDAPDQFFISQNVRLNLSLKVCVCVCVFIVSCLTL